jgi:hypothetical protein
VVDPPDQDAVAEHVLKDRQLRAAERLAGRGRGADRAVILDQQEAAVALGDHARHVAFAAADVGQCAELRAQGQRRGTSRR